MPVNLPRPEGLRALAQLAVDGDVQALVEEGDEPASCAASGRGFSQVYATGLPDEQRRPRSATTSPPTSARIRFGVG